MPDVATTQLSAPADIVKSLGRSAMSNDNPDETGDAGFGKELASLATEEDRAGQSVEPSEDRKLPVGCRHSWGKAERLLMLDQGWNGDGEAAGAKGDAIGEDGKEAAAQPPAGRTVADNGFAIAAASSAVAPANPAGVFAKPLPMADAGIDRRPAASLAVAADAAEPAHPQDTVQNRPTRALGPVQEVFIVRRETHLAPAVAPTPAGAPTLAAAPTPAATPTPAVAPTSAAASMSVATPSPALSPKTAAVPKTAAAPTASALPPTAAAPPTPVPAAARQAAGRGTGEATTAADIRVPVDGGGVPDPEARPPAAYPTVAAARGKDQGQWRAPASLARSPAAEVGAPAKAPMPEEAFSDIPPAGRAAATATQEGLPVPQSPISPVRQIVDRILADVLSQSEIGRGSPVSPLASAAGAPPLKVLTIQLHPADLGAVTVRIALKSDTLEVQIEAGRRDTARLVDADRETLSGLLRSAGYSVETMTVRAVEPAAHAASAGSSHASPDTAPQAQSGGSQPDARASGGRGHTERDSNPNPNPHGTRRDKTDAQDGSRHPSGDGLYV